MRHVMKGVVTAVLLLLVATTASAQIFAGSVSGVVKDQQGGVLPGVTVSLTGKTGVKTAVTDANGIYRFPAVDPGSYVVSAELTGFKAAKQENVTVTVGSALDVPFTMTVGGVSENIQVVGAAPIVDVKSSSTQTEVSQELLYNAPITRTAINVFNVMPGANSSSVYGGEGSTANALLIDGVDTRDPEGGSAWTFYNYNMVQEVQIQGLGAPAEYGGFTGAVVNTITKSGGNRYSGLFDILGTNGSLGSNNVTPQISLQNPALASPAVTKKYVDFTTQLGGPIKQDKLFYFFSAQRFQQDTDPSGPVTIRHEVSPRFNAKLTWQPTANDNYMLSLQYDGYNIIGRAGVSALLATDALTNREDAPEIVWLGQWRHVFNSQTFAEVKYTGWWGYYDLNPEINKPGHFDGLSGQYSVSQGWHYYADRGRDQVNASVSHYADKFGKHELKFGAEFEHSKVRNRYGYATNANFPNGVYYYDYGGAPYLAYSYGYDVSATNNRTSAFAQDSWKIGDRFTLNPGVRLDLIRGSNPSVGQVYSANNVAPRLGFAWDVTGDYNTVIKGAYSQYYEGAMATVFERAIPGVSPRSIYDVTGPTPVLTDTVHIPIYKMDPNIKHPRVDEVYGAIERAIGGSMRLTVTGIYRENKNFINSISPNATWSPVSVTNGLTNAPLTLYKWANRAATQSDFLITNIAGYQYKDPSGNVLGTADPFRKYKAMMVVLNKRLTNRWTSQVSYVLSQATGSVDNTGDAQVSSRQFETPVLALVNVNGTLTNDRTHEFKVLGSYTIPVIEVATNAYWHMISGRTFTPFQQYSSSVLGLSGQSSQYRRPLLEERGLERNPWERIVDLSLEKVFPVTNRDRIGVYMQILNAFNASTITSTQNRVPNVTIAGVANPVLYGAPGTIFVGRQINIGARWSF
jgi:hypothetical protein